MAWSYTRIIRAIAAPPVRGTTKRTKKKPLYCPNEEMNSMNFISQ